MRFPHGDRHVVPEVSGRHSEADPRTVETQAGPAAARPAMNVVDSSGWLEYFADGPNAGFFASSIEAHADLLVPTIALFEVFKRLRQQRGEDEALQAISAMQSGTVVDLDAPLALDAGRLSIEHRLPLADSVVL